MAKRDSEFDHEMSRLEAELKRLEAEYNMFFAGRLPRLPWETRARVNSLIKQYDRMHIRNTADRFRFTTLQARYVAFCDLWERHLKAREEGRPMVRGRASPAPAAEPAPAAQGATPATPETTPAKPDTMSATPEPARASPAPPARKPARAAGERSRRDGEPVVAETAIRDPSKDTERLKELYEQLSSARKAAGEQPLPYDRFTQVVKAQISKLGHGSNEVAFRVNVERGKVTLTAKLKDEE
jgi:hypothetical protein